MTTFPHVVNQLRILEKSAKFQASSWRDPSSSFLLSADFWSSSSMSVADPATVNSSTTAVTARPSAPLSAVFSPERRRAAGYNSSKNATRDWVEPRLTWNEHFCWWHTSFKKCSGSDPFKIRDPIPVQFSKKDPQVTFATKELRHFQSGMEKTKWTHS
jgi:hypothetical protein